MVTVASLPLRYPSLVANSTVVIPGRMEAAIATRVTLPAFKEITEPIRRVKYMVAIKPRKFGEAAEHLVKVARPIEWPTDEPDVE